MVDPRPELATMPLYAPGMPLSQARANSGRRQIIKLASNESLWGPSPKSVAAATKVVEDLQYYPMVRDSRLLEAIAARHGLEPDQIIVGNGADEILRLIAQAYVRPGDEVIFPSPSFPAYYHDTMLMGGTPVIVPLDANGANDLAATLKAVTTKTRLIYLCSPNNPTGAAFSYDEWETFIAGVPNDVLVVLDAAYHEFCKKEQPDLSGSIQAGRSVIWVRTFSKLYALASLRTGWAAAPASITAELWRVRDPFSVNAVGWAAALAALEDASYFKRVSEETMASRTGFMDRLGVMGYHHYPSDANFVAIKVLDDEQKFSDMLLNEGFVVRPTRSFGLPGHIRVTVGPKDHMEEFAAVLEKLPH